MNCGLSSDRETTGQHRCRDQLLRFLALPTRQEPAGGVHLARLVDDRAEGWVRPRRAHRRPSSSLLFSANSSSPRMPALREVGQLLDLREDVRGPGAAAVAAGAEGACLRRRCLTDGVCQRGEVSFLMMP